MRSARILAALWETLHTLAINRRVDVKTPQDARRHQYAYRKLFCGAFCRMPCRAVTRNRKRHCIEMPQQIVSQLVQYGNPFPCFRLCRVKYDLHSAVFPAQNFPGFPTTQKWSVINTLHSVMFCDLHRLNRQLRHAAINETTPACNPGVLADIVIHI